ncbi:Uma2 family endonuclease [Aquihabitans daechungensis]|uniref:Uma2 family endonuclease n=1 Tax=Aquihabitans daechungensis TaxID=1052257 RepID=UPI003B9F2789
MDVVVIDPPADLIAERQRLGLDHHDEVWDGDYHMVPAASGEHQRTILRLAMSLVPIVEAAGLEVLTEWNLIPIGEPGWNDFRVPDLIVFPPSIRHDRGAIGAASLVIEIRSPGDESFEKLPFYERLGVGEVLVIDRDTKAVRRWVSGTDGLVESVGDGAGRHELDCLPVELWNEDTTLVVLTDGVRTEI